MITPPCHRAKTGYIFLRSFTFLAVTVAWRIPLKVIAISQSNFRLMTLGRLIHILLSFG